MKPRILVFSGSIRTDSYHRRLAKAAAAALRERGAEVTYADLRDFQMPLYDGDLELSQGLLAPAKAFKEMLRNHDAFVIASPEYNGSFTALLKNVIDWTSRPESGERPTAVYRGKTAAILGASPGAGGGQRGLRHLRELLEMIGVTVVPAQVAIPRVGDAFDTAGNLVRPDAVAAVNRLAGELMHALALPEAKVA